VDQILKEELNKIVRAQVLFDEPMSNHSSMRVGGRTDAFVTVKSIDELKGVIQWSVEKGVPYMFWGNGTNTLVKDGGIPGLVINFGESFSSIDVERKSDEEVLVNVGAGVQTSHFLNWCIDNGFKGAEFLWGIPGTIGGNIITNAGCAGGEIADIISEITVVEKGKRELSIRKSALNFGTRRLKMPRSTAILSVRLNLKTGSSEEIRNTIEGIREKRKGTQPLDEPSLGCIFKNFKNQSAGALIDDAGFKGVRIGKARISTRHANFVVNEGGASAKDIVSLINMVREKVREKFGVALDLEIFIVGEDERKSYDREMEE